MLRKRLVSAAFLIAGLVLVTFWDAAPARLVFLFAGCLALQQGLREYFRMTAKLGHPGFPMLTGLAAVAMVAIAAALAEGVGRHAPDHYWFWQLQADTFIFLALVVVGFILVFRGTDFRAGVMNLMVSLAGFIYLGWSLSFLVRLYFLPDPTGAHVGRYFFIFLVLTTKCGDIGGYTFGNLANKLRGSTHKLVPRLSPKKSWEGLVGSVLFSAGAAALLVVLFGTRLHVHGELLPMRLVVVWGCVAALLGLVGDLVESVLKRASGVKDAGEALPGMGGLLDVLDSLVLVAPLFYVLVSLAHLQG